jgi:predicted Zn-dependent protease
VISRALLIALLAVPALVVSYLVLPGVDEKTATLMREGRNREAAEKLEERVAKGDARPVVLAQLARAYEGAGNFARASDILERRGRLRHSGAS